VTCDVCLEQCRPWCSKVSSPGWRVVAILDSHRLLACARCRDLVAICSRCDRGNRYCGKDCATLRRREIGRIAERNYRQSAIGRRNNAARQRRFRDRRRCGSVFVTHPSPPSPVAPVERVTRQPPRHHEHDRHLRASARARFDSAANCSFCGQPCSAYARNGFLRRRGAPRRWP
jgi:hypothetical protein